MKPQSKREYLRQLVSEKNKWNRPLTVDEKARGFLGWHERGYLPHCDFPGLVQFVTFRLADSMPSSRRGEWGHILTVENVRERRLKLEEYLDRGAGECHLRRREIAVSVEQALLHFNGKSYALLAWCVMPNHAHVLVHVWQTPLWKIVAAWKKASAAKSLAILREERRSPDRHDGHGRDAFGSREGPQSFWQREYWDTFMRDEEQQRKAKEYIENNPLKANLCRDTKDWRFSSARYRDKFDNLVSKGENS